MINRVSVLFAVSAASLIFSGSLAAQEIAREVPAQAQLAPRVLAAQALQCGNSANADIVMMIDQTGSISDNDLTSEKNAAKTLLNFFGSAATKPRVGLGSFNIKKGSAARILSGGSLTEAYGNDNPGDSGLFEVINNLTGTEGGTDISAAINVAQAELTAHAQSSARYIVIISDGVTNQPSGNDSDQCSGGNPGLQAENAANAAGAAGTSIITIHFGGDGSCSDGTGAGFLGTKIATGPADYYEGNSDLSGILAQISQAIVCDDYDGCTSDACDSGHSLCSSSLIDAGDIDLDGLTNCYDGCAEDALKQTPGLCGCGKAEVIADSDGDGTIDCIDQCALDATKTAPGKCGCNVPDIQGKVNGSTECLCQAVDVTTSNSDLAIGPEQLATMARSAQAKLIRNANKINKALGKRLKKSAKSADVKMQRFILLANQSLTQLPSFSLVCADAAKCATVDNTSKIVTYKGAIVSLTNHILHTLNRATRLVYPSVKIAKKKTKAFALTIRGARDQLFVRADGYPVTQTVCAN